MVWFVKTLSSLILGVVDIYPRLHDGVWAMVIVPSAVWWLNYTYPGSKEFTDIKARKIHHNHIQLINLAPVAPFSYMD